MDVRTPIPTLHGDWAKKFAETWSAQAEGLRARFGARVLGVEMPPQAATDVPIVRVEPEALPEVLMFLKSEPGYEYGFLADYTATDETPREPRFDLVLNLFSHTKLCRVRVKAAVPEGAEAPTLIGVWDGANWAEREIWDMFGVRFRGHPDLRRILMDERWQGHPLRKDYPLRGYQIFPTPEEIHPEMLK